MQEIRSSETTRETLYIQFCFKQYIQYGSPSHKPNPDQNFLEWFIGFFEAKGEFLKWNDSNQNDRFGIEITQKDEQLIQKIRSTLGFGLIAEISKNDQTYWRFYVQKLDNLKRIINLLNGNLITVKKRNQFTDWFNAFQKRHQTAISLLKSERNISFKSAWLSGFFEGDAGFYVSKTKIVRMKKDGVEKFNIKMRFYLTQKDENLLFEEIRNLFKIPSKVYQISNSDSKEKYNRLDTYVLGCHILLRNYLTRYPFLGKRKITLTRWNNLLNYRIFDYPVTPKSIEKVKRCISGLTKDNFVV